MKLLDLFCGAGGAAMGYFRAGFDDITGVDILLQPRYPFNFVCADALAYAADHAHEYDLIHASPPCQAYSQLRFLPQNQGREYPEFIEPVRSLLKKSGKPYIIENVLCAPLENPLLLNGLFFGLKTLRIRAFECSPWLMSPCLPKKPKGKTTADISEFERGQYGLMRVAGQSFSVPHAQKVMGIDWMTRDELAQAIPPAYTEYLGRQMMSIITQSLEGLPQGKIRSL